MSGHDLARELLATAKSDLKALTNMKDIIDEVHPEEVILFGSHYFRSYILRQIVFTLF